VRAVGSRKKKLIAALHFQFSDQAGWECGACRKASLEMRRRCGWIPRALATPERVVWARNNASTTVCPKSFIAAQSMAWLEEYLVRRKLGQRGIDGLGAREVEAFVTLEHELAQLNGGAGARRQSSGPAPKGRNV
jgi:hypothetical protein